MTQAINNSSVTPPANRESSFQLLLIDFSLVRCAWRALRRSRERADFWLWLLGYRRRNRPILMEAIAENAAQAVLHVLRNPEALRRFLAHIVRAN